MANRLTRETAAEHTEKVLQQGAALVQEEPMDTGSDKTKIVAVRLKESECQRLKAFFDLRSLPLSTGLKLAAEYVMELAKAGSITLSKSGIIDRRG